MTGVIVENLKKKNPKEYQNFFFCGLVPNNFFHATKGVLTYY